MMIKENIGLAHAIGDRFIDLGNQLKAASSLYDILLVFEKQLNEIVIEGLPQLMGKMQFEDDVIKGKYKL